ncbi:MAG: hypothetical protein K2N37_00505, partial [Lachnospiraceae bacterium]|nr:hypothetical protein [Lachnospiraceae bacterium]
GQDCVIIPLWRECAVKLKEAYMNKEMKMVVNAIVDEMGRMEERLIERMDRRFDEVDHRFEQVDERLDSLHHEVNACKLSIDAINMRLDQHEKKLVLL